LWDGFSSPRYDRDDHQGDGANDSGSEGAEKGQPDVQRRPLPWPVWHGDYFAPDDCEVEKTVTVDVV
jgi:hypothetical protein